MQRFSLAVWRGIAAILGTICKLELVADKFYYNILNNRIILYIFFKFVYHLAKYFWKFDLQEAKTEDQVNEAAGEG